MTALGHRLSSPRTRRIAIAALLLALAACASGGSSSSGAGNTAAAKADTLVDAREKLVAALTDCSSRYDYDPEAPGLPENALAPNELEWRDCAYAAAREYTRVNTALAVDFTTLIDEDQRLTQAVADGQMTRTERRQRLQPLIEGIRQKEEEQIQSLESDQARNLDLTRQVTEGLRGLH
jgi:hypothetical protein